MKKFKFNVKKHHLSAFVLGLVLAFFLALWGYTSPASQFKFANLFQGKKEKVVKSTQPTVTTTNKSVQAKQMAMEADLATMQAYGLYYDYANMSLADVVKAYLDDVGLSHQSVAFSYKNMVTGERLAMNDTQLMTAGSTYKLPVNMLVVDKVVEGKLSMTKAYDITKVGYEYEGEYQAYREQFGDDMTIPEMQQYSLVYSENTPAYALMSLLGGDKKVYPLLERYGKSKAEVKTIRLEDNKTTTDYYLQVLEYLWQNKQKYADILGYLEQSFPGKYYKAYLPDIQIYQKPGYVREALNVDAIVMEQTPYMIALYSAGLGIVDETTGEMAGGYDYLAQLTYIINQWHRVNMNQD